MVRGVVIRILLVAEALLVAAGHERGARGAAERMGDVAAGAKHAAAGEPVEVRRRDVLAAIEAHVGVAMIIGNDQEEIGPRRLPRERHDRDEQQGGEEVSHGDFLGRNRARVNLYAAAPNLAPPPAGSRTRAAVGRLLLTMQRPDPVFPRCGRRLASRGASARALG